MGDLEQFEDMLLRSARNGDIKTVEEILKAHLDGKVNLDISCKGKTKSNQGWTPLHLASYFGHYDVAEALLQHGAAIDELNDAGDTPLHKAALTNREDVVLLLLEHGASVTTINGEGLRPSDLPRDLQVTKLIVAAEKTEQRRKEERILHYAREGKAEEVTKLLREAGAPNVNCVDSQGNTSLHCTAYRGHIDVAVVLLQNGCDPSIRNLNGQTAYDMAQTQQMQQVLKVQPVRSFHHSVSRFEGPLLRQMRILGWRMVWGVLERGVLTFFNSRADASSGVRRRDYKYLDNSKVIPMVGGDGAMFVIQYNDGTCHRLAATPDPLHPASINRQKWVAVLNNHIRFSTHYVQHGLCVDDEDDDIVDRTVKPLGCMSDALQTATAHQQLMEQQVEEVMATLASLDLDHSQQGGVHDVIKRFSVLAGTACNMSTSLTHCLSLMKQQEEVRDLQLKEEREKVRVLEESLRVLATEHHELEESIASHVSSSGSSIYNTPANSYVSLPRPRRFFDAVSDDEFFDAFSQDDNGSGRTLVNLPSPCGSECSTNTLVSCMSSLPTDPQSPQSPSHVLSNAPCAPTSTPVCGVGFVSGHVEGTTYTVSPHVLNSGWEVLEDGDTYKIVQSGILTDSTTSVTGAQTSSLGQTVSGTLTGLVNTVSGMLTGTAHTTISSGIMNTSSPEGVNREMNAQLSISSQSRGSHISSSMAVETPLVKTSDLSDHSDGSDETVTSDSHRCSELEEKSSFSLVSLGGTRYCSPYVGPQRLWHSWGRTSLPAEQFQSNDFSLWSVLKQCIGKELSKITMPVVFNEPLSFLQRMAEYMEYAWLLEKADQAQDPIVRMQYVTAFAVSGLASNWERVGKPFNPLLGETYELQRDNYRIVCEQVSHHPPVSAFYADSEHWNFHGSIHPKLKFWGKSVEIQPKGILTVELPNHGEAYTWSNVNCCVHNIIVGKLWIEQYGSMEITNHATGHKSVVTFKTAGWFSKDLHRIEGFIIDRRKKKLCFLYGKWTDFLRATDNTSYDEYMKTNAHKFRRSDKKKSEDGSAGASPAHTPRKVFKKLNTITSSFRMSSDTEAGVEVEDGEPPEEPEEGGYPRTDSSYSIDIPNSSTLWEADPRPLTSPQYYHFTLFAMSLNELSEELRRTLGPTDCRLRPDIRLLESGDIDAAANEKNRLEEKQRDARKSRKKGKEEWKARWFEQGTNPFTRQADWLYSGGYWDRNFDETIDIF
ncbi:oxysterol-binding protein-related protein 1-like [Homarus americanus]|nr:oxysterol-binding protein-related protein 1-like [Homarus americanus]XP_042229028.1 oxysterol-binding protein-related protein 1-like [Homarus americanus]